MPTTVSGEISGNAMFAQMINSVNGNSAGNYSLPPSGFAADFTNFLLNSINVIVTSQSGSTIITPASFTLGTSSGASDILTTTPLTGLLGVANSLSFPFGKKSISAGATIWLNVSALIGTATTQTYAVHLVGYYY